MKYISEMCTERETHHSKWSILIIIIIIIIIIIKIIIINNNNNNKSRYVTSHINQWTHGWDYHYSSILILHTHTHTHNLMLLLLWCTCNVLWHMHTWTAISLLSPTGLVSFHHSRKSWSLLDKADYDLTSSYIITQLHVEVLVICYSYKI